jgi:hypothetical protein
MPKLKFFDMVAKKSFETDKFKLINKKGRKFAVATSPSGKDAYRIVGKDFKL